MSNHTGADAAPRIRTVSEARRSPAWRRLFDGVHAAQAAAGYDGRHWGPSEVEYFRPRLIGEPLEAPAADGARRVYWAESRTHRAFDGVESTAYAVKVWQSDGPRVDTLADSVLDDDGPRDAAEAYARARFVSGVAR